MLTFQHVCYLLESDYNLGSPLQPGKPVYVYHTSRRPQEVLSKGFQFVDPEDGLYFTFIPTKTTNIIATIVPRKIYDLASLRSQRRIDASEIPSITQMRQQGYDVLVDVSRSAFVPTQDERELVVINLSAIKQVKPYGGGQSAQPKLRQPSLPQSNLWQQ